MESLYVCHFSNGHIKVGRSIDPKARIAAHADRVACMGVELVEHRVFECVGFSMAAESALIDRCADRATKRNKSEWFEGLSFDDVCDWATEVSSSEYAAPHATLPIKAVRERLGLSQAALAAGIGCTQGNIWHYEQGQTIPPDAVRALIAFAKTKGLALTFDNIYGSSPIPAVEAA